MAKIADVNVGSFWIARVSGKGTVVLVQGITREENHKGRRVTRLSLLNLRTGRELSRTAAFLRKERDRKSVV